MSKPFLPINTFGAFRQVSLDVRSQDAFIQGNGVVFEHYKSFPCPIGQNDLLSIRQPHHEHSQCSNGYVYKFAGLVSATYTSNTETSGLTDVGIVDGSVAQVTFPRFYDGTEDPVYVKPYDRLFIKNDPVLTVGEQKVEAHVTGKDKLTYKAKIVEYLMDAQGVEYGDGDYTLENGQIVWTGTRRPGFDADLNRGVIYSIRYLYQPFFYVSRLMHEVRLSAQPGENGEKTQTRAPYSAMIVRENNFFKDNDNTNSERAVIKPREGLFGPR